MPVRHDPRTGKFVGGGATLKRSVVVLSPSHARVLKQRGWGVNSDKSLATKLPSQVLPKDFAREKVNTVRTRAVRQKHR